MVLISVKKKYEELSYSEKNLLHKIVLIDLIKKYKRTVHYIS